MKGTLKLFKKGISGMLVVFIILTLIITITQLSRITSVGANLEGMSPMQREIYLRRYGGHLSITTLSSPKEIAQNVVSYYKMLLKGDVGWIYATVKYVDSQGNHLVRLEKQEPINEILKTGFERSIKLLVSALVVAIIAGVIKGVFDSKKGKKRASTLKLFTTVIGLSLPVIFLVPLLQFVVKEINKNYGFNFPITGYKTLEHMILPTIALSILPIMYVARITAVAIDKAYEDEYVRTAISKGNSKLRVLWVHVFRNVIVEITGSLIAVLTIIISDLAMVEYLFDYRGLTFLMLEYYDLGQADAVTGLALVLCLIFVFFYLMFKLLKLMVEPKGRSSAI